MSDESTSSPTKAQSTPPGPRCDWRGSVADAWCFSTAEYVVLTNAGALVGFGCDSHLAAILATVQDPAHAMLYRDWLGTPWNPPVPRTGPEPPPAPKGD